MKNIFTLLMLALAITIQAQSGWHLLNPFPTNQALSSVSFIDDNTGWIAGGGGTIMKTTDGGVTWKTQHALSGFAIYEAQFVDAQTGWAVGTNGDISKTTDGGDTWVVQYPNWAYYTTGVQFTDNQHGFVLMENDTLAYTTNGGTQWNRIRINSTEYLYGMKFVSNSEGWICGSNGLVLHTTNGGINWSPQTTGTTTDLNAIEFFNNMEGWTAGYNSISKNILLHTSNGGVKWDTLIQNSTLRIYYMRFFSATTGFAIADKLYRTTDGGKTWNPVFTPSHEGLSDVVVLPSGKGYLCGTDGLIGKTINGGTAWSQLNRTATHGVTISSIKFPDERNGWILSDKLYHSTDSGITWVDQTPFPGSFAPAGIDFVDASRGWIVGAYSTNGQILRTTDGGVTFNFQLNTGLNPFNVVSFSDSLHGIAGTNNRMIYYTANGGATWDTSSVPGTVPYAQIRSIQMVDALNGWAVASNSYKSYLAHTVNGGQTWAVMKKDTIQFTSAFTALSFVDAMHGYVAAFNMTGTPNKGTLLQTNDGGITWTTVNLPSSNLPTSISNIGINQIHFADMMHGWIASGGYESFVMYTNNGGNTWAIQERGTTVSWYSLDMVNTQTGYAAGWYGNIIKTSNASFVGINKAVNQAHESIQIFPNPAGIQLRITNYELRDGNNYLIYNTMGQIVIEGILRVKETSIDVRSLTTGIYFIRVNNEVKKFVKE